MSGNSSSSSSAAPSKGKSSSSNETAGDVTESQEERRKLRKEYRELKDTLVQNSHALSAVPSAEFTECHNQLNNLFHKVGNIREIGIDAEALSDLAKAVKGQAYKLGDISSSFNFASFARYIKDANGCNGETAFDWYSFGQSVGSLFTMVPKWNPILGSLDKEIKERKKIERAKKSKDDVRTENLEEIENSKKKSSDDDDDEVEATNGRSLKLQKIISKKCSDSKGETKPISMFDLLVDINDPVQTIENFFDFSFLIKHKQVKVSEDKNNEITIEHEMHPESISNEDKKQMVMRIDMKDLLTMIEQNNQVGSSSSTDNIKKRTLTELHRTDELYRAANAYEQADIITKRTNTHVKSGAASSGTSHSSSQRNSSSSSGNKQTKK